MKDSQKTSDNNDNRSSQPMEGLKSTLKTPSTVIGHERSKIRRKSKKFIQVAKKCCINNFDFRKRLPLLTWLPKYNKWFIINDIIAGVIVAIVILVQSVAVAAVINVPPEYGIYSSFLGGVGAFFFGTSKDVSYGPSLIVAGVCARFNVFSSPAAMSMVAFISGLFLIAMSFLRLGFIMEFVSYPVLCGFISAGSLNIFISQLPTFFGLAITNFSNLSSYQIVIEVFKNIQNSKIGDTIVGLVSFAISFGLSYALIKVNKIKAKTVKKRTKIAFEVLSIFLIARIAWIILFASIACNIAIINFNMASSFSIVGNVQQGFPIPWVPFQPVKSGNETISVGQILSVSAEAFFLAPIVGLLEVLSTARNFGKQFNYKVDNNQEFLVLGFENLVGSFFRGIPVGGALARSTVNAASGCKSMFGGLITSILVVISMQFLLKFVSYISKSSLAACICAVSISQLNFLAVKKLWNISKLQLITWFLTFAFGLYRMEIGILIGFMVSASFILFRELRPRIHIQHDHLKNVVSLFIHGAVHFPGAYFLCYKLRSIPLNYPHVNEIIIDCSTMYETDTSVVEEIQETVESLKDTNIKVSLKHLKKGRVQKLFLHAGLGECVRRGLRTSSCVANFQHFKIQHHMMEINENPRDLYDTAFLSIGNSVESVIEDPQYISGDLSNYDESEETDFHSS